MSGIVPGQPVTRDQRLAWDLRTQHQRPGCVIQCENTTNVANIILESTILIDTFGCSHCKCTRVSKPGLLSCSINVKLSKQFFFSFHECSRTFKILIPPTIQNSGNILFIMCKVSHSWQLKGYFLIASVVQFSTPALHYLHYLHTLTFHRRLDI